MGEKLVIVNSTEEFDNMLANNKLVLVDFWATWCTPCKMVAPIIDQLAEQYAGKITVAKVDVDQQQDLAVRYGIQTIPTIMLFKDGKFVAKEIGVKPIDSFKSMVDSHIA